MDEYSKLLKYKELLDEGILTKEEFDVKKRELLFAEEVAEEKERQQREEENNKLYAEAVEAMDRQTHSAYVEALDKFEVLGSWKDSEQRAVLCSERIAQIKKEEEEQRREAELKKRLDYAASRIQQNNKKQVMSAIRDLESLGDWGEAPELLAKAREALNELEIKEAEAKAERARKRRELLGKKQTKAAIAAACLALLLAIVYFAYIDPVILQPGRDYDQAVQLLKKGDYISAERAFKNLGDYKDSAHQIENCKIARADYWVDYCYEPSTSLNVNTNLLMDALDIYNTYSDNENIRDKYVIKCKEGIYQVAQEAYENKSFDSALTLFALIEDFGNSKDYIQKCNEDIEAERIREEEKQKQTESENAEDDVTFIDGGVYTGTLTDIIEAYTSKYGVFNMSGDDGTFGGHITLSLKDNMYEGDMKCFPSKRNLTVTFAGTDMNAEQYSDADEAPAVITSTFEYDELDYRDVDSVVLAEADLLRTIDPEIDQKEAFDSVMGAIDYGNEMSVGKLRIKAAHYEGDQQYEFKVY